MIPLSTARAHWMRRQGLLDPMPTEPGALLERSTWLRTLGGVDAWLSARVRQPALTRAAFDAAVEARRVVVTPAIRNCIYAVGAADAPLLLRVAEEPFRKKEDRTLERLGVSPAEIDALGAAVVEALGAGPASPDALRKRLPAGAVRGLGDAGKKLGMSTPLPSALRYLEFAGRVERALPGGRVDSERYEWRLPARDPFAGAAVPGDAAGRNAALLRRVLAQAGATSTDDLAEWTGLGKKEVTAALAAVGAEKVAIEGYAAEAWVDPTHRDELRADATPEGVWLLPFADHVTALHGGPAAWVDPRHHGRPVPVWGMSRGGTLGDARHAMVRMVLVGDRVRGLWEWDAAAGRVFVAPLDDLDARTRAAVDDAADALSAFIRDELGHARSFSLDTDDKLAERLATLRAG